MHIGSAARQFPEKTAIVDADTGASLTFRELDERSNRVAHLLRSLGLKRGNHISFMLPNSFDILDICHAALRAGLFVTRISTHLKSQEIAYIIKDSSSTVFFSSHDSITAYPSLASRLHPNFHQECECEQTGTR